MCMYSTGTDVRSRWLCTAVIPNPSAMSFAMTGLISVSVSTRSPITIAEVPIGRNAAQPPSASGGLMRTPSTVTSRSDRGNA